MTEREDDEWLEAVGDYMICELECQQALEKFTKQEPWNYGYKDILIGGLVALVIGLLGVLMMVGMAYMFVHCV